MIGARSNIFSYCIEHERGWLKEEEEEEEVVVVATGSPGYPIWNITRLSIVARYNEE
jgi:hypothetical protein